MPVLPAIQTEGTQAYAPLSDLTDSPATTLTPTIPSIYTARSVSSSSSDSTASDASDATERSPADTRQGYVPAERAGSLQSESEETLGAGENHSGVERGDTIRASSRNKGKNRAPVNGYGQWQHERDLGDYPSRQDTVKSSTSTRQGDPTWDEEQGRVEDIYGVSGRYPPTNEEEEEERRIQENLARMAARDQARRRASRASRIISPLNTPDLGSAEGFSSARGPKRPTSLLDAGKRNSMFGFVQGFWGGKELERIDDGGEVPLSATISNNSATSNPFEARPPSTRVLSHDKSPFADPTHDTLDPNTAASPPVPTGSKPYSPSQARHARNMSSSSATEQGFSYTGPTWRGGGAEYLGPEEGKEKWWHALCAWGQDLDGGHGNDGGDQAGRTNPME